MNQFQYAPPKRKLARIVAEADEVRSMTLDEMRALPGLLGQMASRTASATGFYTYCDTSRADRKVCLLVREA